MRMPISTSTAAGDRERRQRLAEQQPRERCRDHRLQQQADRRKRRRQVRHRVGDQALAADLRDQREAASRTQPCALTGRKLLARERARSAAGSAAVTVPLTAIMRAVETRVARPRHGELVAGVEHRGDERRARRRAARVPPWWKSPPQQQDHAGDRRGEAHQELRVAAACAKTSHAASVTKSARSSRAASRWRRW